MTATANRIKFRAVLKTEKHSIIVEPLQIERSGYFIPIYEAKEIFEKKYPDNCFWDFLEKIGKQEYIQEISDCCDCIITKDFTNLMQSTGLTDSEGVEIFEGDMVRSGYSNTYGDFFTNKKVIFVKKDCCFGIGETKRYSRITEKTIIKNNIKIIGNIHENPELLEVKE